MTPKPVKAFAALLLWLCLLVPVAGVEAQTTTASVRGTVRASGGEVASATVTAVNAETGFRRTATTAQNGTYTLAGLQPGTYELTVTALGQAPQSRTLQVLIGQSLTANFELASEAVALEGLTVVGNRAVETRTSEVATNVTREQIEALPQQNRNFLNLAGLAPGIVVSRVDQNQNISAGGLPASKINVFIDGTSFKNDVLEGGIHGQDASRGNPFPQIAVREFRVITQNFKAEYQRAASAVVTATTQSGTNEFRVNGLLLGQNKGLVEENPGICAVRRTNDETCDPQPEYERLQAALSFGGPIVQDRLHYFFGYEGNYQNREAQVALGSAGDAFVDRFGQYVGTFGSPFRSTLLFGKLSYQPGESQTLELSYNGRFESDRRGFGGQDAASRAENVEIGYNVLTLQHGFTRGDWYNQAHVSAQRSNWNPTVANASDDIGLNYDDIIRIGARSTTQEFVQDRVAFRNDLTYSGLDWLGSHVVKGGVNVDFLRYDVSKRFDGVPQFFFRPGDLDRPYRATFGEGDPGMSENNVQFGAFLQTDWDVNDRLQLNLGIRWDAETNLFNNAWVTPDSLRQQLGAWAIPDSIRRVIPGGSLDNYFTRGREDRPIFLGAFQPRVGFSYDLSGSGRTVLHGGFGVYYDREIWNRLLDERFRVQWRVRSFTFSPDGADGTIPWRSEYLSRDGLQQIIAQGGYGRAGEIFLVDNDTRPTRTHQWNLGVRQSVADVVVGAAYRGVRGYNVFTWFCATPNPVHGYCGGEGRLQGIEQGYGLVLSTDEGRTWYDALDLTAEKPYTEASRWGVTLAYTLADARRKGLDFFTLDFPMVNPADFPTVDMPVERHHLTASAIVGLPYDFRLSTLAQFGSGIPYNRRDESLGWGPRRVQVDYAAEDAPNFSQVDLRLQKSFGQWGGGRFGVMAEVINVFNTDNFREYEGLAMFERRPDGTANPNPRFGQPLWWTADTGRRLQFGLDFAF